MDTLVQFLRDRLSDDEQTARAAMWDEQSDVWTARPPQASYERYTIVDYCDDGVVAVTPENAFDDGVGPHIARHDPARVLREVDAKRQLVDKYAQVADNDIAEPYEYAYGWANGLGLAVRLLALAYADHPAYRPDWRP
ncbi:DUF6221 family protein [Streptomyces cyaneofuscatus]